MGKAQFRRRTFKKVSIVCLSLFFSLIVGTLVSMRSPASNRHGGSANISASSQNSRPSLASLFPEEARALAKYCTLWSSRGAPDSFKWVKGLFEGSTAGASSQFSMAVAPRSALRRSLERHGFWQPDVTNDLLDALDANGKNSVLLDVGAGYGWFSLAAVAFNHSAVTLEVNGQAVSALQASTCANGAHSDRLVVIAPPTPAAGTSSELDEMLLEAAPALINALSGRVGAAAVHPTSNGGSGAVVDPLEVLAIGSSQLWPALQPLGVVMVREAGNEALRGLDEEEAEHMATVVLHKMHSLGYDVRLDRADGETTAPSQYAGLARTLAQAPQEVCVLWFTRRVGRLTQNVK